MKKDINGYDSVNEGRADYVTLEYLRGRDAFALSFWATDEEGEPMRDLGRQSVLFTELEFMSLGGKSGLIEAWMGGAKGRVGGAAARVLQLVRLPLWVLRRAKALSKKRRGAEGARAHPRKLVLSPMGAGIGLHARKGKKANGVPPEAVAKGQALMEEAVRRGAEQCSYAPYGRYLFGWHEATGRGDEPKRLLREFCQKVDARQKNKV